MKNFEDELLRQISLMRYDRGKILSEQDIPKYDDMPLPEPLPSDQLGKYGDFQPLKNMANWVKSVDDQAKLIYNKIVEEIDGGWAPWKWGTDEDGLTSALMSIKTKQVYDKVKQLLATKYPDSANLSLVGFIQSKEFSNMQNEVDQIAAMGTPIGLGAYYSYHTNDKFLRQMANHLKQFNENESADEAASQLFGGSVVKFLIPPSASEALHIALPVLSFAVSAFPPAAVFVELLDAGLYAAEGDYYSAGLGLMFAFIPGGQLGMLANKLGKSGQKLLMKKVSQEAAGEVVKYTDDEYKFLKALGDSSTTAATKAIITKKALVYLLRSATTIERMFRIVFVLSKKGILSAKFLTTTGIQIGAVFCTWDYIASIIGLCNSMPLKKLTQAEEKTLQLVGDVATFLQRFTDDCDKRRAEALIQEKLNEPPNVKENVKKYLQQIVDSNGTLNLTSLKNSSTYSLNTLAVQIALQNLGYNTYEIKETKTETFSKSSGINAGGYVWAEPKNTDPELDKKVVRLSPPPPQTTVTIKTVTVKFKWGYYDKDTAAVVAEYQNKKGLKIDGECGPNTAKKLIEDINNLSTVSAFDSGIGNLTKEDVKRIEQEVIDQIAKENSSGITKEDLQSAPTEAQLAQLESDIENETINTISKTEENIISNMATKGENWFVQTSDTLKIE